MNVSSHAGLFGGRGWALTQADVLFCALPICFFLSIVSLI